MEVSQQKIIDMTNMFYLEMSKNVLTQREYEITRKILQEKESISNLSKEYQLTKEGIRYIYKKAFFKVKSVSELIEDINALKDKKNQLRQEYQSDYKNLTKLRIVKNEHFESQRITDSCFPFSKRLYNMLNKLEFHTIQDLIDTPIYEFPMYRGFKGQCLSEFIRFLEFENLEDQFEGFYEFKEKYGLWK